MFAKIKAILAKLSSALLKELFLLFLFVLLSAAMAGLIYWLVSSVFTNHSIYTSLLKELYHSPQLVFVFFFALCLGAIYLYRFLLSATQKMIAEQPATGS